VGVGIQRQAETHRLPRSRATRQLSEFRLTRATVGTIRRRPGQEEGSYLLRGLVQRFVMQFKRRTRVRRNDAIKNILLGDLDSFGFISVAFLSPIHTYVRFLNGR